MLGRKATTLVFSKMYVGIWHMRIQKKGLNSLSDEPFLKKLKKRPNGRNIRKREKISHQKKDDKILNYGRASNGYSQAISQPFYLSAAAAANCQLR